MKSVRDRFKLLAKKHKVKWENKSVQLVEVVDLSELEILLEDLTEIEDDTNQRAEECREKKISEDEDRVKALEMRKRAMESIGETRERLGKTSSEERKRRSAKSQWNFWRRQLRRSKNARGRKEAREEERQGATCSLKAIRG